MIMNNLAKLFMYDIRDKLWDEVLEEVTYQITRDVDIIEIVDKIDDNVRMEIMEEIWRQLTWRKLCHAVKRKK